MTRESRSIARSPASSRLAEILGVNIRALLNADSVELDAMGKTRRQSLPNVHGKRFAGGESLPVRELGDGLMNLPAVERAHDQLSQELVQELPIDHAPRVRA